MPKPQDKPFVIPKSMVWEAWRRVKANKGAPGVDGQDLEQFEADLRNNLYKVWNRMSSGTWFPPPVRAVEIPKPHGGGVRVLGVPTIADRVAQTVVAMYLEERADHRFHPDSYGYRPRKSAHQALQACRQRCWKYDWVIDLDVQKFFDTVSWDLVVRAVRAVTDCRWVLLYVERWLAAPLEHPDGALEKRTKGTPQGSAVSPILANLFMHYAFDTWMVREFPGCVFERYADDGVVHCKTLREAEYVLGRIATRMQEVGLELNSDKTRIVYCKDGRRRGEHEH
ncbi:MAG TPA: group II intron reverse transcriptase/maturase, partial [Solirubrobacteraceae bacterium]